MPCYVTGSAEGDRKLSEDEAKENMTKLAQLLCGLLHYVEENDYCADLLGAYKEVPGLEEFWARHKAIDEARLKYETDIIMKKLSPAEITLLKRRGLMK